MLAKDGVDLRDLSAPAWWGAHVADKLHQKEENREAVITSSGEGKHHVKRSRHYNGGWLGQSHGFDLRSWYLSDPRDFQQKLLADLGPHYVVLVEYRAETNTITHVRTRAVSHLHVHWAPVFEEAADGAA